MKRDKRINTAKNKAHRCSHRMHLSTQTTSYSPVFFTLMLFTFILKSVLPVQASTSPVVSSEDLAAKNIVNSRMDDLDLKSNGMAGMMIMDSSIVPDLQGIQNINVASKNGISMNSIDFGFLNLETDTLFEDNSNTADTDLSTFSSSSELFNRIIAKSHAEGNGYIFGEMASLDFNSSPQTMCGSNMASANPFIDSKETSFADIVVQTTTPGVKAIPIQDCNDVNSTSQDTNQTTVVKFDPEQITSPELETADLKSKVYISKIDKRKYLIGDYSQIGVASWYGGNFHGRKTANGENFNTYDLTAAHPSLPFGTKIIVTNLRNGKETIVKINDRGPYVKGRILDLSYAAAKSLGMVSRGIAKVKIEVIAQLEKTPVKNVLKLL